jgi:predicted peptidase
MQLGVCILLVAGTVSDLTSDCIELFEKHQQEVKLDGETLEVNYRLFVPETDRYPERKFPLIVWLHGYGELGTDNLAQLKWLDQLIFHAPHERSRFPFFLLAVQCPREMGAWTHGSGHARSNSDMLGATKVIVDELIAGRAINVDRVYLSGLSSGGSACWAMALRYPEMFAAVAPLGSCARYQTPMSQIATVPVWAFHSKDDHRAPIRIVRETVAVLRHSGGSVHLTELDSAEHDCWTTAFTEHGLLDWLLAQERGKQSWLYSPGTTPIGFRVRRFFAAWTWWQALLELVVLTAFAGVTIRLTASVHRLVRNPAERLRRKGRPRRISLRGQA